VSIREELADPALPCSLPPKKFERKIGTDTRGGYVSEKACLFYFVEGQGE
jgi:hypothetical protein